MATMKYQQNNQVDKGQFFFFSRGVSYALRVF